MIALAVARALSRAGVPVVALGHETDPIRWSRHRDSFIDVGGGRPSQSRFLDWLTENDGGGVVLPCNDDALEVLAEHQEELADRYTVPETDPEIVRALLDKERTYELARAAGVHTPRTITVRSGEDLDEVERTLEFPCALKPLHSHRFAEHFGARKKVLVAENRAALDSAFAALERVGVTALATEIVPGPDEFVSYYGYLDEGGKPLFDFTKRKLRQSPPRFGLGAYHVTDWNPEVAEAGRRFLQGIGFRGLAVVEFKRDVRDGRLVVIESNPRFSAATELLQAAGVNVALLVYNRLLGRPLPSCSPYTEGLHFWIPAADVRAFLGYRSAGELSLWGWARSLMVPQRLPVASFEDPGPILGRAGLKLRRAPRRVADLVKANG